MFLAKISQNTMVEPIEIYITFSFVIDKPPDDPYERKWYFKRKQQYTRFLRFYGNSLVGGIDQAKIITVTETETKKKTGKKSQGRWSVLERLSLTLRGPTSNGKGDL